MLKGLYNNCDICTVHMSGFQLISVDRVACGAGNAHYFRDIGFHSLEECMISPFHYMHYRMCQSVGYVCRLMTICLHGFV